MNQDSPASRSIKSCSCGAIALIHGRYYRKSDGHWVRRYVCKRQTCRKSFSDATFCLEYRQNKRQINLPLLRLLCSGVSQRRAALLLHLTRKTVAKKFEFLHITSKLTQSHFIQSLERKKISEILLDEMEDKVHTKCKPVSIAIAVTTDRKILSIETSRMRPKNRRLYQISKAKYPYWTPNSRDGFRRLMITLVTVSHQGVVIKSDEKTLYQNEIKRALPEANHIRFKSRRAVIAGHGEMKQGGKDPLFALNHTCAMLRANVNRLVRRTWCTSKKIENLQKHIELYVYFHNTVLT